MRRGAQRIARGVGLAWVGGEGGTHDLAGLLIGEHIPYLVRVSGGAAYSMCMLHVVVQPAARGAAASTAKVAACVAHPVTREHDEAILRREGVRRHVGCGGHEVGAEVRAERRVRLEAPVTDGARAREEVLAVGCDDSAEGDLTCRRKGTGLAGSR